MVVSLISQVSALKAQQSLRDVNERIVSSTAKLSSGQRVFSAEDNAAALGIGASLNVEIAALGAAATNASNGVSMLQVAEGALSGVEDMVQRMRLLATQASSDQLGQTEREILDKEYQNLKAEIDRVVADTEFDGQKLLTGGALFDVDYAQAIQGYGINSIEIDNETVSSDATFRIRYDSTEETLTVTRVDGGAIANQVVDLTALLDNIAGVGQNLTAGERIDLNLSAVGLRLTVGDAFDRGVDLSPAVTDNSDVNTTLTPTLDLDGNDMTVTDATTGITNEAVDALLALNGSGYNMLSGELTMPIVSSGGAVTLSGVPGIMYSVNGGAVGASGAPTGDLVGSPTTVAIYVQTASGQELLDTIRWDDVSTTSDGTGTIDVNVGTGLLDAQLTGNGADIQLQYMVGSGVNSAEDFVTVSISPLSISSLGLTNSSLTTSPNAETAMDDLEAILALVNQERTELGASQTRLEFSANKLLNDIENLTAARSSILDVDVSEEISNLAQNQAMSEMVINMLSRINQQPQQLLQLLQ